MKAENKIILEMESDDREEDQDKRNNVRVLSFSLGGEIYGIRIKQAKEMVRIPRITKIPNTPDFVIGAMNLRGEIISLIDVRYFFSLKPGVRGPGSRVIVTDVTGSPVGILVDKVNGAVKIDENAVQAPLATLKDRLMKYTVGQVQLENEILTILDLKKVLSCEEIRRVETGGVQ